MCVRATLSVVAELYDWFLLGVLSSDDGVQKTMYDIVYHISVIIINDYFFLYEVPWK